MKLIDILVGFNITIAPSFLVVKQYLFSELLLLLLYTFHPKAFFKYLSVTEVSVSLLSEPITKEMNKKTG